MNKVIFYLLLFLNTFHFNSAVSEYYYISNKGNDNNNGVSPVFPWKTISKLNAMMDILKPGDAVFFERGGYFIGQINLTASGNAKDALVFGAYGKGKSPVISGAVPVKGWRKYTDKIFVTDADTVIKNLFAGGNQMTLARYPNTGYLKIKKSLTEPTKGFFDSELIQKDGYWNGANLRVRSINWAFEHSAIRNFKNKIITLNTKTAYPLNAGWGYYLDNKFSELDYEKEWYYENETQGGKLYFYPPANVDASNIFTEASVLSFGFYSESYLVNVIISDLEIRNQTVSGINFIGNKLGVKIQDCTFSGQMECGISLTIASRNCEISGCRFYNINGKGIYLLNAVRSFVTNNIFENTGMKPGYGTTNDAFGMSALLVLQSDSNIISKNYISNTGHDGINCIGYANRIEKNIIKNSLLLLNDGAAIKSYGNNNTGTIWNNNFIKGVKGNLEATPMNETNIAASGAYLDEKCSDMKVADNTILNCGMASVFLYNQTFNNTIAGNICFNGNSGIFFYDERVPMKGNVVSGNIFLGESESQVSVWLRAPSSGYIPGKFENNYYLNPKNDRLFSYESGGRMVDYNFTEWKSILKTSEVNSKSITGKEVLYPKLFTNMNDDSLTIVLNSAYTFKDVNSDAVNVSLILQPWTSKMLFANADISKLPEIGIAGGPLDFGNSNENSLSYTQWFNLTGENLKEPVLMTAPDGFEISLRSDSGFEKSLSLNHADGKIDEIIFVKFVPEEEKLYYDFITGSSGSLVVSTKVKGNSR